MTLVLHIGHDATACMLGPPLVCVAEKRVSRIKNYHGFPLLAIDECMRRHSYLPLSTLEDSIYLYIFSADAIRIMQ
jgi:predicted NodU family carbamoyl transferase